MRIKSDIPLLTLGAVLCTVALSFLVKYFESRNEIREEVDSNERRGSLVQIAIEAYRAEFGSYPEGDEAEITNKLTGNNPKNIEFIRPNDFGKVRDGRLVDVWKTPLKIKCNPTIGIHIQSAGQTEFLMTRMTILSQGHMWSIQVLPCLDYNNSCLQLIFTPKTRRIGFCNLSRDILESVQREMKLK